MPCQSSRSRENNLWAWMAKGLPIDCVARRIEDVVNAGTPDVILMWNGMAALVELKSVSLRADGTVWSELKSEQASFLRRWGRAGGNAWVLMQVGSARRYLVRHDGLLHLLQPIHEDDLIALSTMNGFFTPREALGVMCPSTR